MGTEGQARRIGEWREGEGNYDVWTAEVDSSKITYGTHPGWVGMQPFTEALVEEDDIESLCMVSFDPSRADSGRICGIGPRTGPNKYVECRCYKTSEAFNNPVIRGVRHVYGGLIFRQRVYVTVSEPTNLSIRDESGD